MPTSSLSKNELLVATSSRTHCLWLRSVIVLALMTLVYFYGLNRRNKEVKFALVRENITLRIQKFECDTNYEMEFRNQYPECAPRKCGRSVTDRPVNIADTVHLLDLAKSIITKAGSAGGVSMLDMHSGILSNGHQFLDVLSVPKLRREFHAEHLHSFKLIKEKMVQIIAEQFGISIDHLYLTHPTILSRMLNATQNTIHDEYWQKHVHTEPHPSPHYTSILYLSTYGTEFHGGRFIFENSTGKNRITSAIEPKVGRVLIFTSGAENSHYVEKVNNGERYALTFSFTCNKSRGTGNSKLLLEFNDG